MKEMLNLINAPPEIEWQVGHYFGMDFMMLLRWVMAIEY